MLVDSFIPRSCINQSVNIINIPNKHKNHDGVQNAKSAYAIMLPAMTPVHLAHNGICILLIKKLLFAFWWHPYRLPAFMSLTHIYISPRWLVLEFVAAGFAYPISIGCAFSHAA